MKMEVDIKNELEFRSRGILNLSWDIEWGGYQILAGVRSWGISDISWNFVIEYRPDCRSCADGRVYQI